MRVDLNSSTFLHLEVVLQVVEEDRQDLVEGCLLPLFASFVTCPS